MGVDVPAAVTLWFLLEMENSRRVVVVVVVDIPSEKLVHRLCPAMGIVLMRKKGDYCYTSGIEYCRSFI
jgi:hypothetical protein